MEPVSGFDQPGLKDIFHPSNKSTGTTATPSGTHGSTSTSTSTSNPTTSGTATSPKKKTAIGAIAGGVIGGLLGLAALLSLILLCLRRKKEKSEYEIAEMGSNPPPNLDSQPVFEKSGSHVRASELPAGLDEKSYSEFGSTEAPAEMDGNSSMFTGGGTSTLADDASENASVPGAPAEPQVVDLFPQPPHAM
jgi:hypothetical protein